MNDSERLDAIGKYGLCVVSRDSFNRGEWERTWLCRYGEDLDDVVVAPSIRTAIDGAIQASEIKKQGRH